MQPRRRRRPARRPRRGEARDVRCELAYLGEDVSDDDATLQRRRAALKGAYEEEEEEEESEDDEAAPEAIDNRLPKRWGPSRFPSRRARDWALDDAAGAPDRDVASLGAAMARAVGRWRRRGARKTTSPTSRSKRDHLHARGRMRGGRGEI